MTITRPEARSNEMGSFDQRDEQLMSYLGLDPRRPADRAAVAVCRHYDFDPLLKHVIVIPKGGVYVTRDGLLHVAHRSGQLDGIVVDQEPTLIDGEWVAKVSVYRKDMGRPFTYPGRYPEKGSNRDYAPEMALKAAEAHALRRAFPVTGLPTFDEQRPGERRPESATGAGSEHDRIAQLLHQEQGGAQEEESVGGSSSTEPLEDVVDGELVDEPDEQIPDPADEQPATGSPLLDLRSALARKLFAVLGQAQIVDDRQHDFLSKSLQRPIASRKDLTEADAHTVIDALEAAMAEPDGGQS